VNATAVGILNATIPQTVSFGGAATWAKALSMQNAVEALTFEAKDLTWLLSTASAQKWRAAAKGSSTSNFLLDAYGDSTERVGNVQAIVTSYLDSASPYSSTNQAVIAAWNTFYLLIWFDAIDLVIDPYSQAAKGEIVITTSLYWNYIIARPQAVCISSDSAAQ
jgi:hypothetical protein